MPHPADVPWHAALTDLLHRSHSCTDDELPGEINASIHHLHLEITIYLVDHEQSRLRRLPDPTRPDEPVTAPLTLDDGPAGRAFTSVSLVPADDNGQRRLWVAMVDGSERLGVVEVALGSGVPDSADLRRRCVTLVGLIGHLVATKTSYGDTIATTRRSQPMAAAAELLLALMPPLTFTSRRLVVSAVLEPAYDCGGDAFDYSVSATRARLTLLDAMGRGLRAGLAAAVALSALRAARRAGDPIEETTRSADAALSGQFTDQRFVTGVLVDLDLDTGRLRYVNAGHPAPLVLRDGRTIGTLSGGRRLPMGLPEERLEVGEDTLRPGDRLLLYTDGAIETRTSDGSPFGVDRLIDLVDDTAFLGLPAPETLRRLAHVMLAYHDGPPADDLTLLLVEWSTQATERTQP